MKINIKSEESITVEDGVAVINNTDLNSNYYVITKNKLRVLNSNQCMRILSKNCEFITDKIDDIILYYPDALSSFQSRHIKSEPITEENTDLDL